MSRLFKQYREQAKKILDENWTGSSTKPSPTLYPHQWNWDAGFIAIGRSHYDTASAMQEIETLFAAQWSNGMLPQIVFNLEALGNYFPEPDFWQTERSPHAPRKVATSGITMPPIHAVAVEAIWRNADIQKDCLPFLKRMYPRLMALHHYLYRERDPDDEGLVYIRHPWESGIDNSPTWDVPLQAIDIDREILPRYERKDMQAGIDPSVRPSDDDYDRYVVLVDIFRRLHYDEAAIARVCPFLIQDPLFNSILCRANESLAVIATIIGEEADTPSNWAAKTASAIREKLWHDEHGMFDAYDMKGKRMLEVDTAAGFMPLFAGAATQEQAKRLYRHLNSKSFCALHQGNCFTIPNYDTEKPDFRRDNYWRGPIWININWMLFRGLRRYGYTLKADSLQKDLLQLPIRFGFYEYFDSFNGRGYGSVQFSWTAALFIDLLDEYYAGEKAQPRLTNAIRAAFSQNIVMNRSEAVPASGADDVASCLMRTIRDLRNSFYDTGRGRVDYDALRQSREYEEYRTLTSELCLFDVTTLKTREERLAFWINLYNTIVVDGIIVMNIKKSVTEVPGFFRRIAYAIGPHTFSADDMEHGILRANARKRFFPLRHFPFWDGRRRCAMPSVDPCIHFALVCGSRSCAPIDYYDAVVIDEQLRIAGRSFVNSSEVLIFPEKEKIVISEIFRWYEEDFGGKAGVIRFLADYLQDDKARTFLEEKGTNTAIDYLHYDWALNR